MFYYNDFCILHNKLFLEKNIELKTIVWRNINILMLYVVYPTIQQSCYLVSNDVPGSQFLLHPPS